MSGFLRDRYRPPAGRPDHPRLHQRPLSIAEQRQRWEVWTAMWRARELAESVFGRVSGTSLIGIRPHGDLRGVLTLDVPFAGLEAHREREARFMAAADDDPILARVPLVYVFGPEAA